MSKQRQPFTKRMKWRIAFVGIYLGISILLLWLFHEKIFNIQTEANDYKIFFRWVWCFVCGLIGFSFLSLRLIRRDYKEKKDYIDPGFNYSIYYPILIAVITCVVFFIISLLSIKFPILFYFGAGAFSFLSCLFIDNVKDFFLSLLGK